MGFKERLRQAREAKGLTQTQLGRALGDLSKQLVSHWEKGRNEPNIAQIAGLCEILGCSADWLLFGTSPAGLTPEAVEHGLAYERLSPAGKRRFKAMLVLVADGFET